MSWNKLHNSDNSWHKVGIFGTFHCIDSTGLTDIIGLFFCKLFNNVSAYMKIYEESFLTTNSISAKSIGVIALSLINVWLAVIPSRILPNSVGSLLSKATGCLLRQCISPIHSIIDTTITFPGSHDVIFNFHQVFNGCRNEIEDIRRDYLHKH